MLSASVWIGWSAVVVGGFSSVPQLYKTVRTKSVDDISPLFVTMRISSEILYACYGLLTQDFVMVASTAIPLVSDCLQLCLLVQYSSKKDKTSSSPEI